MNRQFNRQGFPVSNGGKDSVKPAVPRVRTIYQAAEALSGKKSLQGRNPHEHEKYCGFEYSEHGMGIFLWG
jgi:hypothetical protein